MENAKRASSDGMDAIHRSMRRMFIGMAILFCLWIATAGIAIAAIANTGLLKSGEALGEGVVTSTKLASHAVASINLSPNAVITEHISASAVTGPKIAVDSVDSTHILDSAVTEDKIVNDAVTEGKIGNGAVTGLKIAVDSVDSTHIADGAVINAKIGNEAVTTAKIGPSAVNEGKILNGAVTEDKIADDAVTEDKIADDAVTNVKIADGVITPEKMSTALTADWPTWIQSNASPTLFEIVRWADDGYCILTHQPGSVRIFHTCGRRGVGHYEFTLNAAHSYILSGTMVEVLITPRIRNASPRLCVTDAATGPTAVFEIRCYDLEGHVADAEGSIMVMVYPDDGLP